MFRGRKKLIGVALMASFRADPFDPGNRSKAFCGVCSKLDVTRLARFSPSCVGATPMVAFVWASTSSTPPDVSLTMGRRGDTNSFER